MKKYLFLTMICGAVISTNIHAQGAAAEPQANKEVKAQAATSANAEPNDAAMLQLAKEKQKAPMVEKTGLTDAQVERIIEINFEIRQQSRGLRELNEAERSVKIKELKELKEKKYSAIPLSAEQIQTVYAYYEDMKKNMERKSAN